MDSFYQSVGGDPRLESGDSAIDRLNSRHTVMLFFLFSVIVTLKQHYVGEPISCWIPDEFEKSWAHYTNAFCWVNSTYYLPFDDEIPKEGEPRKVIGYYQWTSLILGAMGVMFYIPRIIWATFNKKSGIEVTTLTGAAMECQKKQVVEDRENSLKYISKHMARFLRTTRKKIGMSNKLQGMFWRLYGSYLSILYIGTKMGYVLNAVLQLFLLEVMLGLRDHLHGLNFIEKLIFAEPGLESELFPRVAMCDFKIRALGNIRRYTVQCSLPINLFNEKIFICVWFWLVIMTVLSAADLCIWFWYAAYTKQHHQYVKTKLITMGKLQDRKSNQDKIALFVDEYLRRDGIFLIYLIAENSSDLIASEVTVRLWDLWDDKADEKINNNLGQPSLDNVDNVDNVDNAADEEASLHTISKAHV